mmetsp:Transcript_11252/g.31355  ORF Transcript_11252/g.31355 Transcript_11252/m.31355 type:complete len:299 (+) Transcript_11252:1141-2037(+)
MGVDADEVPKAVRHEHRSQVVLHHLLDVSLEKISSEQAFQDRHLRQGVHIEPRHPRLHLRDHSSVRRQHGVVHDLLLLGELSGRRESAGDVGRVAVVLPAHVAQDQAVVRNLASVRGSRMTIMQEGPVLPGANDASVRGEPAAPVKVALVHKGGFELVLHHAGLASLHHLHVRIRTDFAHVAHHFNLLWRFLAPAVAKRLVKGVNNDLVLARVKVERSWRLHGNAAVGVGPFEEVDSLSLQALQFAANGVRVQNLVDAILGLEGFQARDRSEPHREFLWQPSTRGTKRTGRASRRSAR